MLSIGILSIGILSIYSLLWLHKKSCGACECSGARPSVVLTVVTLSGLIREPKTGCIFLRGECNKKILEI